MDLDGAESLRYINYNMITNVGFETSLTHPHLGRFMRRIKCYKTVFVSNSSNVFHGDIIIKSKNKASDLKRRCNECFRSADLLKNQQLLASIWTLDHLRYTMTWMTSKAPATLFWLQSGLLRAPFSAVFSPPSGWPLCWWPNSKLIRSSPIWQRGRTSGIHSITNGPASFCSAVPGPGGGNRS